jgi:hypothetical protein
MRKNRVWNHFFLVGPTVIFMSQMKWKKTKFNFLYSDTISGRYYARFTKGNKQVWKTLSTDVLSVAEARLAKKQAAARCAPDKIFRGVSFWRAPL